MPLPFLRSVLRPIPVLPVPTGVPLSEADKTAHEWDPVHIVALFAAEPGPRAVTAAFTKMMASDEAPRVLHKAFHIAVESRMRALALRVDPPEAYGSAAWPDAARSHPLDTLAADWLGYVRPPVSPSMRLAVLGHALMQMAWLIKAALQPLFGRCRRRVAQHSVKVGAPWTTPLSVLRSLCHEAHERPESVVIVAERDADLPQQYRDTEFATVAIDDAAVELRLWIAEGVRPAGALCIALLGIVARYHRSPATVQAAIEALRAARDALGFRAFGHERRFAAYLDIDEYTATHVVRGIELRRYGCRLIRMPHSQMDEPGASLSFLGYDVFLSAGPYVPVQWGATWRESCKSVSVGTFSNDRHLSGDANVAPDILAQVSAHVSKGGHLIGMFGLSNYDREMAFGAEWLRRAVTPLLEQTSWLLIIKCKGVKSYRQFTPILEASPEARRLRDAGRLILVPYEDNGLDPCPAGWLIRRMDFGVGLGSVQLESLTQGKAVLGYRRLYFSTPYRRWLERHGLWFADGESFSRAFVAALDDPGRLAFPIDWVRQEFDPFGDGAAIKRIAQVVFHGEVPNAAAVNPAVREVAAE